MNNYRATQALLMTLLGLFLIQKLTSGTIAYYISSRFNPLVALAAVGALALAAGALAAARRQADADLARAVDSSLAHSHAPDGRRYPWGTVLLVALPLIIGTVVPGRPLGASAVLTKGINMAAPQPGTNGAGSSTWLDIKPEDRNLLDWVRTFSYADSEAEYAGQPARVTGFIYREDGMPDDQVMLARFVVTCCAVDAQVSAVLVQWPNAKDLPTDSWQDVSGTMQKGELRGRPMPLIVATAVAPAVAPDEPYLFP